MSRGRSSAIKFMVALVGVPLVAYTVVIALVVLVTAIRFHSPLSDMRQDVLSFDREGFEIDSIESDGERVCTECSPWKVEMILRPIGVGQDTSCEELRKRASVWLGPELRERSPEDLDRGVLDCHYFTRRNGEGRSVSRVGGGDPSAEGTWVVTVIKS